MCGSMTAGRRLLALAFLGALLAAAVPLAALAGRLRAR